MTPTSTTPPASLRYRRLWRRAMWHRRKLAAICAAVAVFAALNVLRPAPEPTRWVVITQHDIVAGSRLSPDDVAAVRYPTALAPDHAATSLAAVTGRTVTASVARGTPLSTLSLGGDAWSRWGKGNDGKVAVPVRLQDGAVVDLLRAGQHVRLASVDPRASGEAQTLVDDAVVLAVPGPAGGATAAAGPLTNGRTVVLGVPAERSNLVASQAVSRYLTVIWGY